MIYPLLPQPRLHDRQFFSVLSEWGGGDVFNLRTRREYKGLWFPFIMYKEKEALESAMLVIGMCLKFKWRRGVNGDN